MCLILVCVKHRLRTGGRMQTADSRLFNKIMLPFPLLRTNHDRLTGTFFRLTGVIFRLTRMQTVTTINLNNPVYG